MVDFKNNLLTTAAYVGSVVAVNVGFVYLPAPVIFGEHVPLTALLVGFVFVVRDYCQRQIGHWVIAWMAVACALSYLMASPKVAVASAIAFAIAEGIDWLVYTVTRKPLSQRILLSSLIATPLDSWVFLGLMGWASPLGIALMTACKLVAAFLIYWVVRRSEQRGASISVPAE